MSNAIEGWTRTVTKNQEEAAELVEKLFDVARPGAVFSEPITIGEQAVITASEVNLGMGIGFGGGMGTAGEQAGEGDAPEGGDNASGCGGGGGGGGGGGASARPVAAIVVGPQGVRVEPIVDVTKVALAFFTMLGSMWMFWSRMRRASRN